MATQRQGWRPAPSPPSLRPDEVQVWRVGLVGRAAEARGLASILDSDERARAHRFLRPEDHDAFVLSHGWLRTILGALLGLAPSDVRFASNPCGKPRLVGSDAVSFNLSHTDGLALIAVTLGREIGVDVERLRSERPLAALTARLFTAGEAAAWAELPPSRQCAAFYATWTRKEATLKAMGTGLAVPLDRFDVALTRNGPVWDTAGSAAEPSGWSVVDLSPRAGYAAAVAVAGALGTLHCWDGQLRESSGGRRRRGREALMTV